MSKEKRRVPKLRFPGFTEDWEQRKLGSIGSTYTGLSGKTKEDFGHGEAQYITYLNVFQNTVSDITMTDKVEIDTTQNEVKYGDVLFTTSSETPEEVGMSSVWLGHMPNIYLNSFCFGFRPNQKIDPYFLGYSLRAPYMRDKIKILAQGISRYNISKNKVMELEISLPNNEEQRLLGNFLRNIDLSITLHQRKLDNLKLKKKALLQKLFPKNGERYPELRFPGFTDAWEQRKFSDITYLSGIKNKENKPYESYSISNEFGFIPQDEQFENGGTMKTADKSMYYIVSQNSFAYNPARINVGSIGYYNKPDNVIVSSLYEVFKTTDIVSDKFLWHWFKSNQFNRLIEKYQEGGVRLYFYYDKLCKGTIDLPTINEQNKISNLLDDLDMYITLHQRKLDHLKLQKKALLQQMFV